MALARPGTPIPEKPTTVKPHHPPKGPTLPTSGPWTAQQQLKFTGTIIDRFEPSQQFAFYVLAGPGGPVPTGGWGQVNTIDRPRSRGYTYTAGYQPRSMDVPVRFMATSYAQGGWTPAQVEENIEKLEWMSGFGYLYQDGVGAKGTQPVVQISSFPAGSSVATPLVPRNYQSNAAGGLRWLISNLQPDNSTLIRNSDGYRTFQDLTVSVIEYVAAPGAPTSPRQRQAGRGGNSGAFTTVTTTAGKDTIQKVCQGLGINAAADWMTVVQFNQTRLKVRSYSKQLSPGTQIQVPNSLELTGAGNAAQSANALRG
jgi:hypothetical protein